MSAPRWAFNAARGLVWGTIGLNVYVFYDWNTVTVVDHSISRPEALKQAREKKSQYMMDNFVLSRRNIAEGRWWTILTSAVSHSDLNHLLFNMITFHQASHLAMSPLVGLNAGRLALLGLGSAVCGSLGALYDYYESEKAGFNERVHGLGASGMVQGILVGTMLCQPKLPVNLLFIPIGIPFWTVVGAFIGYDMYRAWQEKASRQRRANWQGKYVGYAAHLGGAAFGAVFYALALRGGAAHRRAIYDSYFGKRRRRLP